MTDIQKFTNDQFGTIRTATDESGTIWFVATDICAALDLSNTTVTMRRLDADEKSKFNLGLRGDAWRVNEAGLYRLVLTSRKPKAKSFKRWVTHEVLPSIRKHGGYLTNQKIEDILNNPDTIIQLATKLKSERAKRAALEKQAAIDNPTLSALIDFLADDGDGVWCYSLPAGRDIVRLTKTHRFHESVGEGDAYQRGVETVVSNQCLLKFEHLRRVSQNDGKFGSERDRRVHGVSLEGSDGTDIVERTEPNDRGGRQP